MSDNTAVRAAKLDFCFAVFGSGDRADARVFQRYERALQGRGKRFIRKSKRAYSFGSGCFRNRANCRDDRYKRRITKFN